MIPGLFETKHYAYVYVSVYRFQIANNQKPHKGTWYISNYYYYSCYSFFSHLSNASSPRHYRMKDCPNSHKLQRGLIDDVSISYICYCKKKLYKNLCKICVNLLNFKILVTNYINIVAISDIQTLKIVNLFTYLYLQNFNWFESGEFFNNKKNKSIYFY